MLEFRTWNNGKGSRAKIAQAGKLTCLSGCWNASVLGGIPGHAAMLPRHQLSALLLCPVLPWEIFVRAKRNARHPAKKSLSRYPSHLLHPKPKDTEVSLLV